MGLAHHNFMVSGVLQAYKYLIPKLPLGNADLMRSSRFTTINIFTI
jgi:hypothetical protein